MKRIFLVIIFVLLFTPLTPLETNFLTGLEKATDKVDGIVPFKADGGLILLSASLETNFLTGSAYTVNPVRNKLSNGVRELRSLTGFTFLYYAQGDIYTGDYYSKDSLYLCLCCPWQLNDIDWKCYRDYEDSESKGQRLVRRGHRIRKALKKKES
ncbi:MAG: hypothetical protein ISS45_08585 [Candidatus Omnitrophica bacterium]|nr:hypothetical protein [Candidatus Omnitrophota bacterium]